VSGPAISVLEIAHPRTREQWEACQLVATGRAYLVLLGRDPRINRLARQLAALERTAPKRPARRLVLTPAEVRAAPAPPA
jgi:hypothetical protein